MCTVGWNIILFMVVKLGQKSLFHGVNISFKKFYWIETLYYLSHMSYNTILTLIQKGINSGVSKSVWKIYFQNAWSSSKWSLLDHGQNIATMEYFFLPGFLVAGPAVDEWVWVWTSKSGFEKVLV